MLASMTVALPIIRRAAIDQGHIGGEVCLLHVNFRKTCFIIAFCWSVRRHHANKTSVRFCLSSSVPRAPSRRYPIFSPWGNAALVEMGVPPVVPPAAGD